MSDPLTEDTFRQLINEAMNTGARLALGIAADLAAKCETGDEAASLIGEFAAKANIWDGDPC